MLGRRRTELWTRPPQLRGATHSRVAVQHDAAQLFVQGKDEAPDLSCIIAGKETIWAVFFRGQLTVEKREAEDSPSGVGMTESSPHRMDSS